MPVRPHAQIIDAYAAIGGGEPDAFQFDLLQLDGLVAARRAADPACALFVADSMAAGVELAEAGSSDVSGDWVNEIHFTLDGYRKCADAWQRVLDPLLG